VRGVTFRDLDTRMNSPGRAGDAIGGYRLGRLLGAGGMGEVYAAYDARLDREVAVKILPAAFSGGEHLARFDREARILASLNHPNIAAIYGIEDAGGAHALVLELVPGDTLADLIARGPVPPADAAAIVRQIADGLHAAHARGIVHRDLKPANVKLTHDGRVKVLDFGIAKAAALLQPSDATMTANVAADGTMPGMILGTAAYMSPEQARGAAVDHRTDIWALGCVLYELLCGRSAFARSTAADTLGAIVATDPDWSALPAATPRHLRRLLRDCLQKDPARRPENAQAIVRALDRPEHVNWRVGALLVFAIGAAVAAMFYRARLLPPAASTREPAARTSVAVLGFKNLSNRPDAKWLSTALAEMLVTEIADGNTLRPIAGEDVGRMKLDLGLNDEERFAADTLARIRQRISADLVVIGSYVALDAAGGGKLRLDLRVQDTTAGNTVVVLSETGTESELFELVRRVGDRVRGRLGAAPREPTPAQAATTIGVLPVKAESARLYAEGLDKLRTFDAMAARDLLERAVAAEPDHPLPHAALAEAWSALGFDAKAKAESARAVQLSEGLPRAERLFVAARAHEMAKEWTQAIESYSALRQFYPDRLEYSLRLAAAFVASGRGAEAMSTVQTLRSLPAPLRDDARIDFAESEAAQALGDMTRMRDAAVRAAEKAAAQGARLLVARAREDEAWAWMELGDLPTAALRADEAQRLLRDAGDPGGQARAMNTLALVRQSQGRLDEAQKLFEAILDLAGRIGDRRRLGSTESNFASLLWERGDLDGARRRYEIALAIAREVGDRLGEESRLNNIGVVQKSQGVLEPARRAFEDAIARAREVGKRDDVALYVGNLAETLLAEGDLSGALARADEGIALGRESGSARATAHNLFIRGQILAARSDRAGARRDHEEALELRKRAGDKFTEAESRVALADIAVDDRQLDAADALLAAAVTICRELAQPQREARARVTSVRVLLARGEVERARGEAAAAEKLLPPGAEYEVRLAVALARADADAATRDGQTAAQARDRLNGAIAVAERNGWIAWTLEAKLAAARLAGTLGKPDLRARELRAVRDAASRRGFTRIAAAAAL
jgi:tetratricopeptide (TPR) repeat protein/TolB-like protein